METALVLITAILAFCLLSDTVGSLMVVGILVGFFVYRFAYGSEKVTYAPVGSEHTWNSLGMRGLRR